MTFGTTFINFCEEIFLPSMALRGASSLYVGAKIEHQVLQESTTIGSNNHEKACKEDGDGSNTCVVPLEL